MTSIKIIIPWRADCPNREANLGAVRHWWAGHYPDWPVYLGEWPAERGPWRKGSAVRQALIHSAPTDVVVIADADVIIPGVGQAVEALETGRYEWTIPQRTVYRLTPDATKLVVGGSLVLPTTADPREYAGLAETNVCSPGGGGAVALTSEALSRCPMDPRFAGYGQEDHSWSRALYMLAGAPYQVPSPLWHLWHTPQPRLKPGDSVSRGIGSLESLRLWTRYRMATTRPLMEALMEEARNYGVDTDRVSDPLWWNIDQH
jgi:hypothetical protein